MNNRADFHHDFATALRDRNPQARPPQLTGGNADRFAVYRNNVYRAHIDALADAYPVVTRLVGIEFFEAMAREYYQSRPHKAATLALYGAGFAGFIEQFPPADSLPYLADVARLERARLESLHAADAVPLTPAALTGFEEDLPSLRFTIHPACRLVSSAYPVHSIWQANQRQANQDRGGDPQAIPAAGEAVLIARPVWEVTMHPLTPAETIFTQQLLKGQAISEAFAAAVAQAAEFDITATFGKLLTAAIFTTFTKGEGS